MKTSSSFAAFLGALIIARAASAQQLPPPATVDPAPQKTPPSSKPKTKPPVPIVPPDEGAQILPAPAEGDKIETPNEKTPDDTVIVVPPEEPELPVRPPDKIPSKKPRQTPKRPLKVLSSSISIGGVDVTGLSQAAAMAKLKRAFEGELLQSVALWDGGQFRAVRRAQIGVSIPYWSLLKTARARRTAGKSIDVPLRFEVDAASAQKGLRDLEKDINQGATTQKIEIAIGGSTQRIQRGIQAATPASRIELVTRRVAMPTQSTLAAAKTNHSDAPQGFPYLLASFSTHYDAGIRGRTNNLKMAAKLVNGTIVPAGATFSANRAIGPRNAEAGWREAKMFVSGQIVNGIGSGICQCSTTIYNAALLAGLPIVERHPHMFRVTYAPASRDAAIYWGQKDMKFRNTTSGPIYVQTFLREGRFHARLFGTSPRTQDVRVESRVVSRRGGTRSEAYRVIQTASGPLRQRLSSDHYMPHP